jgi:DNA polymerase-3 subunit epsilon
MRLPCTSARAQPAGARRRAFSRPTIVRATDQRLSARIQRIEFEGNRRRNRRAVARSRARERRCCPRTITRCAERRRQACSRCRHRPGRPTFIFAAAVEPAELAGKFGPFTSKRHARETLGSLASEHSSCWKALGLERRLGPCFARQVKRCAGACVGAESAEAHHERLHRGGASRFRAGRIRASRRFAKRSMFGDAIDVQ